MNIEFTMKNTKSVKNTKTKAKNILNYIEVSKTLL